jgi:hypothetical protein
VKAPLITAVLIAMGLALAGGLVWRHQHGSARRGVALAVRGGDGGGLPLDSPADEHMDATALARIAQDPAAAGLRALLITRHGHLVYSQYGHGLDAHTVIDSGGFARVLVALAAGIAGDEHQLGEAPLVFRPDALRDLIETQTHEHYADYLGDHLWSRLNAAPAWIEAASQTAPAPADCCFHARILDWLRVGELLATNGSFEETTIVSEPWMLRMRQPQASGLAGYGVLLPSQRPGAPSYEARDLLLLRGPAHWRLWVVPSLQLVVLFGAGSADEAASPAADPWDETRVPNMVIEAVVDRPAPTSTLLQQLVHGH